MDKKYISIIFDDGPREPMREMIDKFIGLETDTPKLLYIWGHSYEFDFCDNWDFAEEMCRKISGKADIFYGTNRECFGL